MQIASRTRLLARWALGCPMAALACGGGALAQQAEDPPASVPTDGQPDTDTAIVVTGIRGSAVIDVAPLATLSTTAIAATGATTMAELLQAIRGTTQAADGSEPIFLLNGQRVSGYPEIGSLPPEAIETVEVLPEQAALRFGFPSVDAPSDASGNWEYLALVGCCHLSGLLVRRDAAGPYGSSRTGSTSPKRALRHGGKPWISGPVSPTVVPYPPSIRLTSSDDLWPASAYAATATGAL